MAAGGQRLEARSDRKQTLLKTIWKTGAIRIYPFTIVFVFSVTTLWPLAPSFLTDYFASRHSLEPLHCDHYTELAAVPKACQDAHGTVVFYQSLSDFTLNSIVLFILAPMIGRWSDKYGRKPFMLATFLFASLPFAVLAAHINFNCNLLLFFVARAMNGLTPLLSLSLAMVADLLPPSLRAAGFGLVMASVSLGMLIGPSLGGLLPPLLASWVGCGGIAFCTLWAIFVLPETLSHKACNEVAETEKAEPVVAWKSLHILARMPLFVKLTAVLMLLALSNGGFQTIYSQFFQQQLHFTTPDQSMVFIVAGVTGLFGQTIVLRLLISCLGETRIVILGCVGNVIAYALMAFSWNKSIALLTIGLTSIGDLATPAISSLKSKNVPKHEQGQIQGAIFGASSFAQGFGPLIFAALYNEFGHESSRLPYFPGAPFLFGAALLVFAAIIGATINHKIADTGLAEEHAADEEAGELTASLLGPGDAAVGSSRAVLESPGQDGCSHLLDTGSMTPAPLPVAVAPGASEVMSSEN